MTLTPKCTAILRVRQYDQVDIFGNDTITFQDNNILVFGWYPRTVRNQMQPDMDMEDYDIEVMLPPTVTIAHQDKLVLDGVEYRMVGELQSLSNTPFNYAPGNVARVKRVGV